MAISKAKTIIRFSFLFLSLTSFQTKPTAFKRVSHKITLEHPGEKMPVDAILIQIQDKEGLPVQYYMDVESVICLEQVCKIISVRIYWDNIGVYQKYELEEGATLEKYEYDFFDPEDYKKLDTILANIDSPYKEVYIDEILTVVDELSEDIDAVSGATALELDEKDTVPGAALTCFTLWHWVNGNVISSIKKITGESVSKEQLKQFLEDKNQSYFYIALKELHKRKIYDKTHIDIIIKRALKNSFLLRPSLNYLKKASAKNYFYAMQELFFKGAREQKIAAIKSLINTDYTITQDYLNKFSTKFCKLNYQEISLLLELMSNKNSKSKIVIERLIPLLEGNFIIARRVYWFLNDEELNEHQKQKVIDFYSKNKSQL